MMQNVLFTGLSHMGNKIEATCWENQPFQGIWPEQFSRTPNGPYNIQIRPKKTRIRTAFTTDQLIALEKAFRSDRFIDRKGRVAMSQSLNLSERIIKIWFQNRRMKEKREILEKFNSSENLSQYEIDILRSLHPSYFADSTKTEDVNDTKMFLNIPSKPTGPGMEGNVDQSTNNINYFNQSHVNYNPYLNQSSEVQNSYEVSRSFSNPLLPRSHCEIGSSTSNSFNVSNPIENANQSAVNLSQVFQSDPYYDPFPSCNVGNGNESGTSSARNSSSGESDNEKSSYSNVPDSIVNKWLANLDFEMQSNPVYDSPCQGQIYALDYPYPNYDNRTNHLPSESREENQVKNNEVNNGGILENYSAYLDLNVSNL